MPARVVSVERSAYNVPTCNVNIQYGSRAHSVHYNVPGQSASYYRTEYRPDNKMSAERTDGDIKYWIVTLDNGARVSLALYLFLLEPQPGDEFEEYEVAGIPIWVRVGEQKIYSNVVLGGAVFAFSVAIYATLELFAR